MSDHPNGEVRPKQSRMANIKSATSAIPPPRMIELILKFSPDASIVYAVHNEIGKVEHAHYVVRFPSTVRWTALAQTIRDIDGHDYAEPAKSWRRSVRYCLHLDNPEKAQIDRSALKVHSVDESELSQLIGSAKLPILQSLSLAEKMPLNERFSFLVCERGHNPSEVYSALRCMMELERWCDTRTARSMRNYDSALPDSTKLVQSLSWDPDDSPFPSDDCPSILDDDINPFPDYD